MSLEWIKDKANQVVEAIADEGHALADEAQHLVESVEHIFDSKKAGSAETKPETKAEAKPEVKTIAKGVGGLPTDEASLKTAALKAEAKSLGIKTAPKYDGSTLDAVRDIVSKVSESTTAVVGTVLSSLGGPVAAGLIAGLHTGAAIFKVAENIYQSADKKLTINKVNGADAKAVQDSFAKLFEDKKEVGELHNTEVKVEPSQDPRSDAQAAAKPASIEFNNIFDAIKKVEQGKSAAIGTERVSNVTTSISEGAKRWLFDSETERASAPNPEGDDLFAYKNEIGGKTEISTLLPGHVHIEAKDQTGKTRTVVDKTADRTMVLNDNETVVYENGKTTVKGPDYKVTWDELGKRHVEIGGVEFIRSKDNKTVEVVDKTLPKVVVSDGQVKIGDGLSFVNKAKDLAALTREALEKLQKSNDNQVYVIAAPGGGTRTIAKDGTTVDLLNDRARLTSPDGNVIQLEKKDDKYFVRKGDELVSLEKAIADAGGKYNIGSFNFDASTMVLTNHNYSLDLSKNLQKFIENGQEVDAVVKKDNCITVKIGGTSIENNLDDAKITVIKQAETATDSTLTAPAIKYTINPDTSTVEIKDAKTDKLLLTDTVKNTTIEQTQTVIDADHTVHIGGTVVNPDGGVQVDKHTYVDKDLHVVSTAGYDSNSKLAINSITQAIAQTIAITIGNKASAISNLAKSGAVRWAEVATLNSALGDVLGLMSSLPAGSPAYSMLMQSYRMLVDAINLATPKAVVSDKANDVGITAPSEVKAVDQGANKEDILKNKAA